MIARPETYAPRPEPLRAVALGGLAVALFLASWALLHVGFYTHSQVDDTLIYRKYGAAVADGKVPYRDFRVEYPPAALPFFALPSLVDGESYRAIFEGLMAACGAATILLMGLALRELRAGFGVLVFAAVTPLLLGSVVLTRFDLWPAALSVGALAALMADRSRLGLGVLATAVAAKLYPLVLLPIALVWVDRRQGRRAAHAAGAVFVAVLAAWFVPFLVLAPDGVASSVGRQLSRPLQIESLGAGFLLVAHQVADVPITMKSSHGSQNLAGAGPAVLAVTLTLIQVATLVGIWIWFWGGPAERWRLVRASAAALVAFVALGKVLSPQFLIWLIPIVPLVAGRRGLRASALLALALVLTQLWFPYRYWDLVREFAALPSFLVLARDLVLVWLLIELVRDDGGDARELVGDEHRTAALPRLLER